MALLTASAIQGYKDYTLQKVAYAKYKVGSTYYQVPIQSKVTLPDGRVAIYILIDHTVPGNITITQIQLYDTNNQLWLQKTESILREDIQEGILYRFTFDFTEQ
jgi:hypothetical protein